MIWVVDGVSRKCILPNMIKGFFRQNALLANIGKLVFHEIKCDGIISLPRIHD